MRKMSHTVIPPLSFPERNPSQQSLNLMEKKLEAAEEETRHLLEEINRTMEKGRQLGPIGLNQGDFVGQYSILNFEDIVAENGNMRNAKRNRDPKGKTLKNFSHSLASSGKIAGPLVESLSKGDNQGPPQQNYDALISRMCRTESAIQTLKLNLLSLKGNYELKKKQQVEAEEKLATVTEHYSQDVNKLERALSRARQDLNQELEARTAAEDEIKSLKEDLQASSKAKSETEAEVLGFSDTREKLNKKIQGLHDDLSRERSLRESLEESHKTLLTRVREMETVVETERSQLRSLTENCNELKAEAVRAQENLKAETDHKQLAFKKCGILEKELGEKMKELGRGEEERELLRSEISKLKCQYEDLIHQLEHMEKLMLEHQEVHADAQGKNQHLKEALEAAEMQRNKAVEMERENRENYVKMEEKVRQLQGTVKQLESENEELVSKRETLENEVMESSGVLKSREREFRQTVEALESELTELRGKLSDLQQAKERAMKDKESLLEEVNSAVDGMSDERWRLRNELQDARVEIQSLTQARKQLEAENSNLQDRIRALSCQQSSQKQLDAALNETTEQKNRLAYDKGRLQSQVTQLQAEVNALASSRTEVIQLNKQREGLEAKYLKCQKELSEYKVKVQRLEGQVKQCEESGERRDKDFSLAIQSRDEALKENCQLLERLNDMEEQESHKLSGLDQRLEQCKRDNRKLTHSLEEVMASHTQLQTTVESLHQELGHKDSQISQLTTEKSQAKSLVRDLQHEAELLKERLVAVETLESKELEPLRKALKQCREDNTKMANSLEDVLDSNCGLQTTMDKLQADMEKKDALIAKLKDAREKEFKTVQNELKTYEERLKAVKDQLKQEREKSIKKTNKDVLEMKKQTEGMSTKNGELSRANLELRHKLTEQEVLVKELRQKLSSQKAQNDHMARAKKQMEEHVKHLKVVREELDDLEKVRDEYVEKNEQQAASISDLLSQLGSLQCELRHLAQAQYTTQELVQQKDDELRKERALREEMARKYMDSRRSREETEKQNKEFEERIRLANEESLEVSRNLEAAHDWFKCKFDSLQDELVSSKRVQAELEHDNDIQRIKLAEERQRAKMAAMRAKQMIKSSRKTISRLGDYTELTGHDPKRHVMSLHDQIEKELVTQEKTKTGKSKVTSSQQLEALINRYSKR